MASITSAPLPLAEKFRLQGEGGDESTREREWKVKTKKNDNVWSFLANLTILAYESGIRTSEVFRQLPLVAECRTDGQTPSKEEMDEKLNQIFAYIKKQTGRADGMVLFDDVQKGTGKASAETKLQRTAAKMSEDADIAKALAAYVAA